MLSNAHIFRRSIYADNQYDFAIPKIIRHPGGRRDPDLQQVNMRKAWIPTFVGMTDYGFGF
jgi:hypothetical protein